MILYTSRPADRVNGAATYAKPKALGILWPILNRGYPMPMVFG